MNWQDLHSAAVAASKLSYSPYSKFPVGAAALTTSGKIVSGCNVENASYGLTLCAECSVVSALVSENAGKLVALVVVDGNGEDLMPCGRCRQLISEFASEAFELKTKTGSITMPELLPNAFGPGDLK